MVTEIAAKYQVSVPQLSICYDYQQGLIPLPRSTNPVHIAENKNIDFVISDADMKRLSQVEEIQSLDLKIAGNCFAILRAQIVNSAAI